MSNKVVINLATGLEDAERVTVAFLVGGAAAAKGKQVAMFLTKEAVRLGLSGHADAVACDGCPALATLFEQYVEAGGELLVCPICVQARKVHATGFVANAEVGGTAPMWQWIGDDDAVTMTTTWTVAAWNAGAIAGPLKAIAYCR